MIPILNRVDSTPLGVILRILRMLPWQPFVSNVLRHFLG